MDINAIFSNLTRRGSRIVGHPASFLLAIIGVILWLTSGWVFNFSDDWHSVINGIFTSVTLIIVFLIQSTQNRDTLAIQIKLDEIIRSQLGAHNSLLDLENLSQQELIEIKEKYENAAKSAKKDTKKGIKDTHNKEI